MSISRKLKREAVIQGRKALRSELKDKVVRDEMLKKFQHGIEIGSTAAAKGLLDILQKDTILTPEQYTHYEELTKWKTS